MLPLELQDFINSSGLTVPYIFKYGSRVYGTATDTSDYDYIGITLIEDDVRQIKLSANVEITLYYIEDFMDMIGDHHITALECLWQDNIIQSRPHIFSVDLRPSVLRESISAKISHCWVKGKKKITVGSNSPTPDDRYIGLKSIFHAFRICDFGIQIAQHGKIIDYSSANKYWDRLKYFSGTWKELDNKFRPEFNALKHEFKCLCPKM